MKTFFGWLEAGFAVAAILLICLFCAYAWPEKEFAMSGWVQAVGSIAALAGAYIVGERQASAAAKNALHISEQADLKRQAAYLAIATAARDYVAEIGQSFHHHSVDKFALFMSYHERIAADYVAAMTAVPIHELGSAECVKAWFATKNALLYFQKAIDYYVENVNDDHGGEPEKRAGDPGRVIQCSGYLKGCYSALAFVMQPAERSNHL